MRLAVSLCRASSKNRICWQCPTAAFGTIQPPKLALPPPFPPNRTFSYSHALLKKGGKEAREARAAQNSSESVFDPSDFSILEATIEKALGKLRDDLSKLRAGGRLKPEVLETLRVHLGKGGKETVRLADLAQVVPKGGRTLQILVGDKEYIRPITSAIQSSSLSLAPQADPQNQLHLNIAVPPPTKESRMAEIKTAQVAGEKASLDIRSARQAHQKKMKAVQNVVRPDDMHSAAKSLDKVAEKGQAEVKKIVDGVKKMLDQA